MNRFMLLVVLTSSIVLAGCGKSVITEECVMNGRGEGTCSFTNTGSSEGSTCGKIIVSADKKTGFGGSTYAESSTFCSGNISPNSTSQTEFFVPRVSKMCSFAYEPWNEICKFQFSGSSGSGSGWINNLLILVLLIVSGGLVWHYFPMLKGLYKRNSRKCPYCAESVKPQAIVCKNCGKDIHEQVTEQNTTEKVEEESAALTAEEKSLPLSKLEVIKLWWKQNPLGGKLIAVSLFMAMASMFMNRPSIVLFTIGTEPLETGVSVYDVLVFVACWLYPVFVILKNKSMKLLTGIAFPSGSLLWVFYNLYEGQSTKMFLEEHGYGTGVIGMGIVLYLLASILHLVGAAMYSCRKQSS